MEFLLLIAALVGLVWLAVIVLRGGLFGGELFILLVGSCFGHAFFHVAAGPLPITADRLLLGLLVVQCFFLRRWGMLEPARMTRSDYLLVALLVLLTLSTFTHEFRYHNSQPLSTLIFFYLLPAAFYWAVRQTTLTPRQATWLCGTMALFGVYLSFTAMAEAKGLWNLVYPRYIITSEVREFFGRGRGPFLNPVANGIVIGLGMCAALMFWPRLNRRLQLLLLAVLPVYLLGVYFTLTRSTWMGAAAALLIIIALSLPRVWRLSVLSTTAIVGTLMVALLWQHLMVFKRDKDLDAQLTAESALLRPILATVAWHMFLDRPLLGCGFGQYVPESRPYLSDRSTDLPLEKVRPFVQHNVFFALLTETGLLGTGLFIALLASWGYDAWRLWRAVSLPTYARQAGLLFLAMLGLYLPNGFFHDVSIIAMVNMFLFFLGGITTSLAAAMLAAPRDARLATPAWSLPQSQGLAAS